MQILPRGVLEVKCRNGVSKGVPALVKEFEQGDESEADGGGDDDGDEGDVSMSGSSNIYWLHLYNADTNALLRNMSNKVAPHFNLSGIDPNTRVEAVVVTTNRQGRSEPVTLEGAVERAVGSRAGEKIETLRLSTFLFYLRLGQSTCLLAALFCRPVLYPKPNKRIDDWPALPFLVLSIETITRHCMKMTREEKKEQGSWASPEWSGPQRHMGDL